MTAQEFLVWCTRRDGERWELVHGEPLRIAPVEMMAGARRRHDQIVTNLIVALGTRMRGKPCRPYTADFAMLTSHDANVRRPDVLIDCAEGKGDDLSAREPAAAFEVLSPSNANFTRFSKVDEYKAVPSLRHIIVLDSEAARLVLYSRAANDAWINETIEGAGAVLPLTGFGINVPLAEMYAEVSFPEAGEA
ncbi:MAG TPA: Uma2 family endonuclease [Vitreimonas sp.]|nr:Uma2 family endonuclease [Vitreimonas sp.]